MPSRWPGAVVLLAIALAGRAAEPPPTLVALGEDGRLVVFRADRPETVRVVTPSGIGGRLLGIDMRPADGHLYGLTSANEIYVIDPGSGAATYTSVLTV